MDKQTTDQVYRALRSIEMQCIHERLEQCQMRVDAYFRQLEAKKRLERESMLGWVWAGVIMVVLFGAAVAARGLLK